VGKRGGSLVAWRVLKTRSSKGEDEQYWGIYLQNFGSVEWGWAAEKALVQWHGLFGFYKDQRTFPLLKPSCITHD
jgi:hypothetical protein